MNEERDYKFTCAPPDCLTCFKCVHCVCLFELALVDVTGLLNSGHYRNRFGPPVQLGQ